MQTYSTFRPTQFDAAGIGLSLPFKQHWLVAPCSHDRDSGPLTESNWAIQLKALGGESDSVEVHRFGHWGPGWFEIVIIDPARADLVKIAEDMESSLADYPVLDDEDFFAREHDDYVSTWTSCRVWHDFIRNIRDAFRLSESAYDKLEDADPDVLRSLYEELLPSGDYCEQCDNGANFGSRTMHAVRNLTRERLASFLRSIRQPVAKQ